MNSRPGTRSRVAAARLLGTVLREGRTLGEADSATGGLDDRDRAFARHLAYGVLRWYAALEWLAGQLLERPLRDRDRDIHYLLLIGLFQAWKDDAAEHAAVHASAEAARQSGKRWAVGLVNAVLRRFLRERAGLLDRLATRPERHAHPGWLLDELQGDWPDDWPGIVRENNMQAPLWIRVNRRKTGTAEYRAMLREAGLDSEPSAGLDAALKVSPAVPVSELPGFHQGLVSVQDAAAQLAAGLLGAAPGERVLDACAAPGGKTCHLLESVADLRLTALDLDPDRLDLVRENLQRLGLDCDLRAADATDTDSWWDGTPFDRILLDAPCTATGVIRRHPEVKWLRSEKQLQSAQRRQRALLDGLWPLLKAGGILVYATCSILRRENSKQIHEFLSRHAEAQSLAPPGGDATGLQILPGTEDMDGFYYAVLRKPD